MNADDVSDIVPWLILNNYTILTCDFDDFEPFRQEIVILGLSGIGKWTSRSDIIADCIGKLNLTFKNQFVPPDLYMLNMYDW